MAEGAPTAIEAMAEGAPTADKAMVTSTADAFQGGPHTRPLT